MLVSSYLGCRSHATLIPLSWLSRLGTLCCVLRSSHDRTRTGDDEETRSIGVATDYHKMSKWAPGFAVSGEVSQSVRSLSNTEQDSHHTRHK